MKRAMGLMLWLAPLAMLANTACGMYENCRGLTPEEFESGVYQTYGASSVQGPPTIHSETGPKTLTLDAEAGTVVLEYVDADGREIVENWRMNSFRPD